MDLNTIRASSAERSTTASYVEFIDVPGRSRIPTLDDLADLLIILEEESPKYDLMKVWATSFFKLGGISLILTSLRTGKLLVLRFSNRRSIGPVLWGYISPRGTGAHIAWRDHPGTNFTEDAWPSLQTLPTSPGSCIFDPGGVEMKLNFYSGSLIASCGVLLIIQSRICRTGLTSYHHI